MKNIITLILFSCLPYWVMAQTYPDHYGTGQYQGVTVTSSNEETGTVKNLALNQRASQSSDFSATNFFASYANDGDINTMNHTKTPSQVNADTSDVRNLALRKPIRQFSSRGFSITNANDGDLSTMNHTISPDNWSDYNVSNTENIALNKIATQSSDYDAAQQPASNANDGSISTINHTLDELHAWWEVDLEEIGNIKSIEILNRTDCCNDRLDSFYVFVSEVPFTSTDPNITVAQAEVTSFPIDTVLNVHEITVEQMGRYVRIQLADTNALHLREVKVIGLPNNTAWMEVDLGEVSDITNINLHNRSSNCCWGRLNNSYVFISDTPFTSNNVDSIQIQAGIGSYYIGTADRYLNEIEVNRTGRYVRVQLTNPSDPLHLMELEVLGTPKNNSWWQVDLGTACDITDIEILNRTSCCSERLDNFYLFVSDKPFVSEDLNKTINKANVSSYFTADALDVNTIPVNRTGRFVRIQLDSQAPLHMTEVRVFGTPKENTAINTVNGNGTLPNLVDASRFLSQATFGYNYEEIEKVSEMGIDAWLDEQFGLPYSSYEETYQEIRNKAVSLTLNSSSTKREYLSYTFLKKLSEDSDYLRHKTANALSQILVVSSDDATLRAQALGLANYYDILYQGAYGNFRDILSKVSVHTTMGAYLSSFRNSKADFGLLTFPDENYAREVMQLFTIGLLELNNDGSLKLDSNGEAIPTYTNEDIVELAKVFTGMATGRRTGAGNPTYDITFSNAGQIDFTSPMVMYETYHDKQTKTMIDGTIIPAGQDGFTDIEDALDVLFNHPNVGPFIGRRLIQQFVKSNPSPAYINRVANAFNDNGLGVRGDLGAVVKAVLTDPEARTCTPSADTKAGKFKQPTERLTNLFLAFDVTSPSGKLWFKDQDYVGTLEQGFLGSPSVFNFFSPFYAETEYVEPNDMVSPEFNIFNSTSSIYYLNIIENAIKEQPFENHTASTANRRSLVNNSADKPSLDISDEIHIMESEGIDALLDRLDILLCRGQLTIETRNSIKSGISQYQANVADYDSQQAVKDVLYFIMISPDYLIQE